MGALLVSLNSPGSARDWALALHGGAGVIERARLSPERERAIRAALLAALDDGTAILARGGSAVDAVEATVAALEASPFFNAGVGAALTAAGTVELDAAIVDGRDRRAGAVTGVTTTRSPVRLARRLMEEGPHVFLAGAAADAFARARGLEQVDNGFFITPERRRMLEELRRDRAAAVDEALRLGTVGAVAMDRAGNLAAATSTGGLTGKAPGRIGDSPVIGAGTAAENGVCAVSATGVGEVFLRVRAAGQLCDRIRFGRAPARKAAEAVLGEVRALGGEGGLVVLDGEGRVTFALNAPGMYRAAATARSAPRTWIWADER